MPSAYDAALAYLTLLLDNIGADKPIYDKRIEESSLGALFGHRLTLRG